MGVLEGDGRHCQVAAGTGRQVLAGRDDVVEKGVVGDKVIALLRELDAEYLALLGRGRRVIGSICRMRYWPPFFFFKISKASGS